MNIVHCLNNEYQNQLPKPVCKIFCIHKYASDSKGVGTLDLVSRFINEGEMAQERWVSIRSVSKPGSGHIGSRLCLWDTKWAFKISS